MANLKRKTLGAAPVKKSWIPTIIEQIKSLLTSLLPTLIFKIVTASIEDVYTNQINIPAAGSAPTLIITANPKRNSLQLKNIGSGSVWIGSYNVSTKNGYKLTSTIGDSTLTLIYSYGAVWGINDTGGTTVQFIEE